MTFLTIYTDVLDRLGENTAEMTVKVKRWINQRLREVCSKSNFPFLEASATLNEVKDTEAVSLASLDYLKIYSIIRTDPSNSDNITILKYLDPDEYDIKYKDNTTSGDPRHYTIWGSSLKLGPRPDVAGTGSLAVKYLAPPTALSGDSDVPVIPEAFQDLLVLGAYIDGLKEGEDTAEVAKEEANYRRRLNELVANQVEKKGLIAGPAFSMRYKDYRI